MSCLRCTSMEQSQYYPLSCTLVQHLHRENPTEHCHFLTGGTKLDKGISLLQSLWPSGVTLFPDSRPAVRGKACIQTCDNFYLQEICKRIEQLRVCIFNVIERLLQPSCQCVQFVDDIGISAKNATDFSRHIGAVLEYIRRAKLKLTIKSANFGSNKLNSLAGLSHWKKNLPQAQNIRNFFIKLRLPK